MGRRLELLIKAMIKGKRKTGSQVVRKRECLGCACVCEVLGFRLGLLNVLIVRSHFAFFLTASHI